MDFIDINTILTLFSGIAFVAYGLSVFFSSKMQNEFNRFKLQKYSALVGALELLGGLGLLVGIFYTPVLVISSLGLALLMFLGVVTRIRIKDTLKATIPAAFFLFLNTYLFIQNI